MKFKINIHKDNIFATFIIEELFDSENITGDMPIKKQILEVYKMLKIFEGNGYKTYLYIRG